MRFERAVRAFVRAAQASRTYEASRILEGTLAFHAGKSPTDELIVEVARVTCVVRR